MKKCYHIDVERNTGLSFWTCQHCGEILSQEQKLEAWAELDKIKPTPEQKVKGK